MANIVISIGSLKWPVAVARRRQNFDPPGGVGVWEDYIAVEQLRAAVEPATSLTFYGGEQIDIGITHRITFRWLDYLDNTYVVVRDTLRRNGTTRRELFRIRRVKELNGRKRFTSLDCELEQVPY